MQSSWLAALLVQDHAGCCLPPQQPVLHVAMQDSGRHPVLCAVGSSLVGCCVPACDSTLCQTCKVLLLRTAIYSEQAATWCGSHP